MVTVAVCLILAFLFSLAVALLIQQLETPHSGDDR
jgi:hypothetical protein